MVRDVHGCQQDDNRGKIGTILPAWYFKDTDDDDDDDDSDGAESAARNYAFILSQLT